MTRRSTDTVTVRLLRSGAEVCYGVCALNGPTAAVFFDTVVVVVDRVEYKSWGLRFGDCNKMPRPLEGS